MSDEPFKTPLHDLIASQGGTHLADGGWYWAEGYGDLDAEYRAARDDVATWDVSPMNKWDFRGSDALRAAQRVFSNDALGLELGQARYGALLDPDGLMVDDGTVFRLADDHLFFMTNGMDHQGYFAEHTAGMNVSIEWITPQICTIGVIGPRSREVMSKLADVDISVLRYFRFFPEKVTVGGVPTYLSRTGYGGELGYELFSDAEDGPALWAMLMEVGVQPFGVETIEILRIEAGLIVTDYDYEAHTRTPYDFNLERLVALDKPIEFLGKERLRQVAANPPNRFKTLRLQLPGEELPEYGAEVSLNGDPVGTLTSPTNSPRFGPIGQAVLRTDVAKEGNVVDVVFGDGTIHAEVDVLPIYDTEKKRPRA